MNRLLLEFPYDVVCSKNKGFLVVRGRIISSGVKRQSLKTIEILTAAAMKKQGTIFEKRKMWLSIHVEKPHHRGDAINVLDILADGIKKGIGIDDKWFAISKLDYSFNKMNPRIVVDICQYPEKDKAYELGNGKV